MARLAEVGALLRNNSVFTNEETNLKTFSQLKSGGRDRAGKNISLYWAYQYLCTEVQMLKSMYEQALEVAVSGCVLELA